MPPKNGGKKGNTTEKKKKIVEEKTFGMKNKNKSKKVQQKIQMMERNATQTNGKAERAAMQKRKQAEEAKAQEKIRRDKEKAERRRKAALIKQPEVPFGTDPKSIVCEYFRADLCNKGDKCMYSHDLGVERKVAKRSMFEDLRDKEKQEKEADTMDKWDVERLAEVINQKQDASNRNLPTKIICKHFLDAIESGSYGWFWSCKSGKDCKYRHALPEGYVLKSEQKRLDELKEKGPTLEELIEVERCKIGVGTPVNEVTFAAWMRRKRREAARAQAKSAAEREKALKMGKAKMSGREAFTLDNTMLARLAEEEGGEEFDLAALKAARKAKGASRAHQDENDDDDDDDDDESDDDAPTKIWEGIDYLAYYDSDDEEDLRDAEILAQAKAEAVAKYNATKTTMEGEATVGDASLFEGDTDVPDFSDDDDDAAPAAAPAVAIDASVFAAAAGDGDVDDLSFSDED